MDREIWCRILNAVRRAARSVKPSVRCPLFDDWLIVAMYFWSCGHDRPQCWACQREHYGLQRTEPLATRMVVKPRRF